MRKMYDVKCEMQNVRCEMSDVKWKTSAFGFLFSFLPLLTYGNLSQITNHKSQIFFLRLFLVSCSLFLFYFTSFSQSVSATVDQDKILIGEQIILELKADNINPQTSPIAAWFAMPDTINHIEVVKRSPIDTLAVNGTLTYTQTITITSFDSGDWQLPPLFILLQKGAKKDSLFTSKITVQVLPVDVSNLQQYHPIKNIIEVDVKPNYLFIALIAALVVFLALFLYFILKKKQNKKPPVQPVAMRSVLEKTLEELTALQQQNPPALLFYTKLDQICRTFIQQQLRIGALQLTSDELMLQLNAYWQGDERTQFYQLLRLMNAVKFAKYQPEEEQKITDINTAKAAVQNIYQRLQSNRPQHA